MEPSKKTPIGDESVKNATGKTWEEWFAILDSAGGEGMTHKEIVAFLAEQHQAAPWWQQSVTVAYEQARGKREKHQMPEGYQISRSRTFFVPLADLYNAWADESARGAWLLGDEIQVRKATPNKSLRITWSDGSSVEALFSAKGETKSQAAVQHSRLRDAELAERMKAFWSDALDKLNRYLERSL
jgi:uncharacterized protein YndB with AHSA1/START domain